jgi:hypothetical protein
MRDDALKPSPATGEGWVGVTWPPPETAFNSETAAKLPQIPGVAHLGFGSGVC